MAYVPASLTAPDAPSARAGRALLGRSVVAPLGAVVVFLAIWEAIVR
jgi:hypothetical protein